jgi:hypothetical protein
MYDDYLTHCKLVVIMWDLPATIGFLVYVEGVTEPVVVCRFVRDDSSGRRLLPRRNSSILPPRVHEERNSDRQQDYKKPPRGPIPTAKHVMLSGSCCGPTGSYARRLFNAIRF